MQVCLSKGLPQLWRFQHEGCVPSLLEVMQGHCSLEPGLHHISVPAPVAAVLQERQPCWVVNPTELPTGLTVISCLLMIFWRVHQHLLRPMEQCCCAADLLSNGVYSPTAVIKLLMCSAA